jgi:hypothetical protein
MRRVRDVISWQLVWKSSTLTNEIDDNVSLLGDGCSIIHHWLIMKNYLPMKKHIYVMIESCTLSLMSVCLDQRNMALFQNYLLEYLQI